MYSYQLSSSKRIGTNGKFISKLCIYQRQLLVVAKLKDVSKIINYQIKIILVHFMSVTSLNTTFCYNTQNTKDTFLGIHFDFEQCL